MTIDDARSRMRGELLAAGIETAAREADWILEWGTGLGRAQLLVSGDRTLTSLEEARVFGAMARRVIREPLQYILGTADFYGRPFSVAPGVLIPRPETEHLIEEALALLPADRPSRVLDAGTGSGCIAITLAIEAPEAEVHAMDVSSEALRQAASNARTLAADVCWIHGSLFEEGPWTGLAGLDLIASNPPYVPDEDEVDLEPELAHEPRAALFVGPDPDAFVTRLARKGRQVLRSGGALVIEIHAPDDSRGLRVLESEGYREVRIVRDLAGLPRVLIGLNP